MEFKIACKFTQNYLRGISMKSIRAFFFVFSISLAAFSFSARGAMKRKILRTLSGHLKKIPRREEVRRLRVLACGPEEARNQDLFLAAREGNISEIEDCLREGVPLNIRRKKKFFAFNPPSSFFIDLEEYFEFHTPLQAAIEGGDKECVEFMLRLGARDASGGFQKAISSTAKQDRAMTDFVFQWSKDNL